MARKIILKENGLAGSGTAPSGYKFLGDSSGDISEKIGATVSAIGGGSSATTTVVNISSAQILAMGTTPIELLPAPGVGKYYDIEKIILEFEYGTTQYTTTSVVLYFSGAFFGNIISDFIASAGNRIGIYSMPTRDLDYAYNILTLPIMAENASVTITTYNGDDPTLGDGTLRAIITYTVRTFGA